MKEWSTYVDTCDGVNADVMTGMRWGHKWSWEKQKSVLPPFSTVSSRFDPIREGVKWKRKYRALCD